MSFLSDTMVFDLEDQLAATVGILLAKGIFTADEFKEILAEVKRQKEEKYAEKKGTNA